MATPLRPDTIDDNSEATPQTNWAEPLDVQHQTNWLDHHHAGTDRAPHETMRHDTGIADVAIDDMHPGFVLSEHIAKIFHRETLTTLHE